MTGVKSVWRAWTAGYRRCPWCHLPSVTGAKLRSDHKLETFVCSRCGCHYGPARSVGAASNELGIHFIAPVVMFILFEILGLFLPTFAAAAIACLLVLVVFAPLIFASWRYVVLEPPSNPKE